MNEEEWSVSSLEEKFRVFNAEEQEKLLLQVLDASETSVEPLFNALLVFTKKYEKRDKVPSDTFGNEELIVKMMKHMDANTQSPKRLSLLCLFFKILCRLEKNRAIVDAKGGLKEIIKIMLTYPDDTELLVSAFAALANVRNTDLNRLDVEDQGVIEFIITAMKNFKDNTDITWSACAALGIIAFSNEQDRREIAKRGAIEAIVDSMKRYKEHYECQYRGCYALWNLAVGAVENKLLILESGGIQCIITAMNLYKDVCEVQEDACGALSSLSRSDETRVIIAKEGGIRAIVRAIGNFRDNSDILENGSSCLLNLSADEDVLPYMIKEGALGALLHAMKAKPNVVKIQENGSSSFYNFVVCSGNTLSQPVMRYAVKKAVTLGATMHPQNGLLEENLTVISEAVDKKKSNSAEAKNEKLIKLEANETNYEYVISLVKRRDSVALKYLVKMHKENGLGSQKDIVDIIKSYLLQTPLHYPSLDVSPCQLICSEHSNIYGVPQDIILQVFALLDPVSLSRCGQVCRLWNSLSKRNHFWKNFCRKLISFSFLEITAKEDTDWRHLYLYEDKDVLLDKMYDKCRAIHESALEAVSVLKPESLLLDGTLQRVHQCILAATSQEKSQLPQRNEWPSPSKFDDIWEWMRVNSDQQIHSH